MGSRSSRYQDIQNSVLMQEHEEYMENQVLNPANVGTDKQEGLDQKPVSDTGKSEEPVKKEKPVKSAKKNVYPSPFVDPTDEPKVHRYQALVNSTTQQNMRILSGLLNMSITTMCTVALEEFIDRKIKEYAKAQGK